MKKAITEIFYSLTIFFGVLTALLGSLMLQDAIQGKKNMLISILIIISGILAFSFPFVKDVKARIYRNPFSRYVLWFSAAFAWLIGAIFLVLLFAYIISQL